MRNVVLISFVSFALCGGLRSLPRLQRILGRSVPTFCSLRLMICAQHWVATGILSPSHPISISLPSPPGSSIELMFSRRFAGLRERIAIYGGTGRARIDRALNFVELVGVVEET